MKIIVIGTGNERDKQYLSVITEAGYTDVEYVDASCGIEQAIQNIKQMMLPDDAIFVKGSMSSADYLSILLAFRQRDNRAYHLLMLQKHQQTFGLVDAAMNILFTDPQVYAEVLVSAATKYLHITGSLPVIYMFEAAVNPKIAYSHDLYVETKKILDQVGIQSEIRQLDTIFSTDSCDAKGLEHPAQHRLIACSEINSADAIMKSFILNHWVGRGYIFNMMYNAILNSRVQDIRSTVYCIKELELIQSKEKRNINNDNL